jgi:peptidoglycan/xylan/chitin deacetylase (PgdA/CDA1 family)
MDYLVRNYHVVSLGEILDFLERKRRLPRKSVAITFDDGYLDNYVNAYPYLKKYHLPATIFIATAYVQKTMLLDNVYLPMLSWNEIVEMIHDNIDIGAHTASHPDLSRMDIHSAKRQILESKIEIEKRIRRKVDYFAYPFGRYENNVVNLIRCLGFRCAFGGEGVIQKDADIFVIHRVEVKRSISQAMFKMRLTVALNWYREFEHTFKRAFKDFPLMSLILEGYNSLESQS